MVWFQYIVPKWFVPMLPTSYNQNTGHIGHWWLFPSTPPPDAVEYGGQWWIFFALPIGLLFFTAYVPKLAWMNRLAISTLMMGFYSGLAFTMFMGLIGTARSSRPSSRLSRTTTRTAAPCPCPV